MMVGVHWKGQLCHYGIIWQHGKYAHVWGWTLPMVVSKTPAHAR